MNARGPVDTTPPATADEARRQAHAWYATALKSASAAAILPGRRFIKRKRAVQHATLAFAAANWLLLEEQRLRSAEPPRGL